MSQQPEPRTPHQDDVDSALNAYLNAKAWDEAIQILEAQEHLLLCDVAVESLQERITLSHMASDISSQSTSKLEKRLRVLEDACASGIAAAEQALQQRIMESSPWWSIVDAALSMQPNLRPLAEYLIKRIVLGSTKALSSMPDPKSLFPDNPFLQEIMALLLRTVASPDASSLAAGDQITPIEMLQQLQELLTIADLIDDPMVSYASPRKVKVIEDTLALAETTSNPIPRAMMQFYLAEALGDYFREIEEGDVERRIALYTDALQVFNPETTPYTWATAQRELGRAFSSLGGEANRERAIFHYEKALQVISQSEYPDEWAQLQLFLGIIYGQSGQGADRNSAIHHFQLSLQVLHPDTSLFWWALAMAKLASFYDDTDLALSYIDRVIEIGKDDLLFIAPRFYIMILCLKAEILETSGQWAEVHTWLKAARDAWLDLMIETQGKSIIDGLLGGIKHSYLYLSDARILLNLDPPNLEEAVIALEEGRAQVQRMALGMNSIPTRVARSRAKAFIAARDALRAAQREMAAPLPKGVSIADEEGLAIHKERLQQVRETYWALTEARDAIREYDDPDFLSPRPTIKGIVSAISAVDEALVYLVADRENGMAVVVTRDGSGSPEIHHLALPQLTKKNIWSLFWNQEASPFGVVLPGFDRYYGGYVIAQLEELSGFILLQEWGKNVYDTLAHLPSKSTFARAAQQMVAEWKTAPRRLMLLDKPFDTLTTEEHHVLEHAFNHNLLNIELKRLLETLGELGLERVATWLQEQGKRKVAIVPYGELGSIPFPAVVVTTKARKHRLGDLFEVTLTPSARALEIAKNRAVLINRNDRLILAAGNPQPLPLGVNGLEFSEAEAQCVEQIATSFGVGPVKCLTGNRANRKAILEALPKAWLLHLSMHGRFQLDAPHQSQLLLAGRETVPESQRTITLEECLNGDINLRDIRLLVLSACETSIIDIKQMDEVVGLATGFLQAGAAGVIATHWAVYDYPTYLLMSRFMQLFLDPERKDWSPARCLAEAQRWLREEATYEVLSTYNPTKQVPLTSRSISSESLVPPEISFPQMPLSSRKRSLRSSQREVLAELHLEARKKLQADPYALPYQDPIYWAAFTVTGC